MAENKLQLTTKLINDQKGAKEIIELQEIQDNWIQTFSKVSGKSIEEATNRYEAEKIMFMQAITGNYQLQNADKFSIYSAWTELAISGGTLRDGICYIVPFGKKAVFMPGWKYRLEQINELPNVIHCHQPQVVYEVDDFEYEKGMKTIIHKHKPGKREEGKRYKITHVYFVIEFKGFTDVYIMEAADVLRIRNQYSVSFKQYMADITAKNIEYGKGYRKTVTPRGGNPFDVDVDPPMWVKDEDQAFRKTIVKQVWNTLPKLPKQKWLEDRLAIQAKQLKTEGLDGEEMRDASRIAPELTEKGLDGMILKEEAGDQPQAQETPPAAKEEPKKEQPQGNNDRNRVTEAEIITDEPSSIPPEVDYSNPNEGF